MMTKKTTPTISDEISQLDKFKDAARKHEADQDESRWDERLKRLVKVKPKPIQSPPE